MQSLIVQGFPDLPTVSLVLLQALRHGRIAVRGRRLRYKQIEGWAGDQLPPPVHFSFPVYFLREVIPAKPDPYVSENRGRILS